MSRRSAPAAVPPPTDPQGWNALLSNPLSVEAYFTPAALGNGTTKRFLDAYAEQYRCHHDNTVAVEDLAGETVAALCLDCDRQLSAASAPAPPRDYEAEHKENHHGHPAVFLLACRECAYEQNPSYREWEKR